MGWEGLRAVHLVGIRRLAVPAHISIASSASAAADQFDLSSAWEQTSRRSLLPLIPSRPHLPHGVSLAVRARQLQPLPSPTRCVYGKEGVDGWTSGRVGEAEWELGCSGRRTFC